MRLRLALLACLASAPAAAQPSNERVRQEAASYLRICISGDTEERQLCARARDEFVREYLLARAGEYQGQRNVAFLLGGSSRIHPEGKRPLLGPVIENHIQSCAWRIVIMSVGHPQVGDLDTSAMQTNCRQAGDAGLSAARARAQTLIQQIAADPVRDPPSRNRPRP